LATYEIDREIERLRQERETFEQQRSQDERWFRLRLRMGYAAIVIFLGIMFSSIWILYHSEAFPPGIVKTAAGALFGDALALIIAVWKVIMNPKQTARLQPVTVSASQPKGRRSRSHGNTAAD
jgi:hypothetical protein